MLSASEAERTVRAAPVAQGPAGALAAMAASGAGPSIAQLNVSANSRMHIGPKFVSVTQTVHTTDVVKGRAFGLELEAEATARTRRLRCGVAVFACWALVVAAALAAYLARASLSAPAVRLDLDLHEPWYLRRTDWQALPAYGAEAAARALRLVLVGHSATPRCEERYDCTSAVLAIQRDHLRARWADVGPNFLVAGDGLAFEGRGAGIVGVMVRGWRERAVQLMFVGDYRSGHDAPAPAQIANTAALLAALERVGALHAQYAVRAHCAVVPDTYSPGARMLAALRALPRWDATGTDSCLERPINDTAEFERAP